ASVASLSNGFALATGFLWPAAAVDGSLARAVVIATPLILLTWVNVIGVKPGARIAVFLSITKTLPLLFFIFVGFFAIDWSLLSEMRIDDTSRLGEAALLLLFAYAGFENTAAPAGEYKNPKRDVPFALLMMILLVTSIYTLVQLVALGTLP